MPSESFYGIFGLAGGALVLTGVGMATHWDYEVTRSPAIGWLFTIGGLLLGILAIGTFIDLRKRFRDWKISHDYDELGRKKRELKLKEKKKEFEDTTKLQKTRDVTKVEAKPAQESGSSKKSTENISPTQSRLSRTYPREFKPDEPILETNKQVPESLKHKEHEVKPVEGKKETTFTDEDFLKSIKDSLELKSLWSLLHAPGKRYETVNKLYDSLNEEADHRKQHNKACDELAEHRLILKENQRFSQGKRIMEYYTPVLSDLGEKLIKQARDEKVISWKEFQEKYGKDIS